MAAASKAKRNGFSQNHGLPGGISQMRRFNSLARPDTINLGLGKPHVDMPAELRSLAIKVLADSSQRLDYSENAGLASARASLEGHYDLPRGSTILTHGAQEGLFVAMLAHLNPDDEVLVPDPGFPAYARMAEILGAKAKTYPLRRDGFTFAYDIERLVRACTKRTKMVVLCSPGNPTGSVCAETGDLAKALAKRKIWLICDEVYSELAYSGEYRPAAFLGANIISVNALSKSHALTGWRIGWLASLDKRALGRCLVAHQYLSTCTNVPAQRLLEAILREGSLFTDIIRRFRLEYRELRDLALAELGDAARDFARPDAGFYLFLPVPRGRGSSLVFCKKLLERENILLIPGAFFGSQGERFYRLSFATDASRLRAAAHRLRSLYRS